MLDSVGNGTASIIKSVMLRKQADTVAQLQKAEMARQTTLDAQGRDDRAYQRERNTISDQRADRDRQDRMDAADREATFRQSEQDRTNVEHGYTPPKTTYGFDAIQNGTTPITPMSPIRKAYLSSASPAQSPDGAVVPPNAQSAGIIGDQATATAPTSPSPVDLNNPAASLAATRPRLTPSGTPSEMPQTSVPTYRLQSSTKTTPAKIDYAASLTGQGEQHKEAFDREMEKLKSGDEKERAESLARLNSTLDLDNKIKFLPIETRSKIEQEMAKQQALMPKTEEMRIAGLMPELVSSVKSIDQYDAPNLVTKLGSRGTFGNYVVSPEGQQFNQSAAQFLQALAFARSGKRINDAEIERMRDAYIPKPGDSDAQLSTKRKARQLAIQGVLTGSGRGANFVPPEDLDYLRGKGYASGPTAGAPAAVAPAGSAGATTPAASLPALTDAQKTRAATDPTYKQFLMAKGYPF